MERAYSPHLWPCCRPPHTPGRILAAAGEGPGRKRHTSPGPGDCIACLAALHRGLGPHERGTLCMPFMLPMTHFLSHSYRPPLGGFGCDTQSPAGLQVLEAVDQCPRLLVKDGETASKLGLGPRGAWLTTPWALGCVESEGRVSPLCGIQVLAEATMGPLVDRGKPLPLHSTVWRGGRPGAASQSGMT